MSCLELGSYELGHAPGALAYALQFDGAMRQWEVVGKWVPLSDRRASCIIDGTSKWLCPMWSQIDEGLILRYTPMKTEFSSGAEVVLDLKALPMVVEELTKVPIAARYGPLIVNSRTGLPYRNWYFGRVWDKQDHWHWRPNMEPRSARGGRHGRSASRFAD